MLFNSQIFIMGFLPVLLVMFYLAAGHRSWRQALMVVASLGFYGAWNWRFVPLLAGLTLANWLLVQGFGRRRAPVWLYCGIGLNLVVLGLFKYANFLATDLDALIGRTHSPWPIVLPLGISFFVFQKLSYLIDLKRRPQPIYGLLDFFEFVTFFPQLIAGPLVRHNEIIPQFDRNPRGPDMWENLSRGAILFIIGLVKKAALADSLAQVADPLFQKALLTPLGLQEAWAAAGCYTLQIYFDFSGYSDMAIGLALMFGLRLPFNFDAPYRSASIREFWRRWHITLSRFLRDYLYIPLGGNRWGALAQARNVVVTMLLGGLWHGAAWTFVCWGGLHGAALAVNGAWDRLGTRVPRLRMPGLLGWAVTMLFVTASWVLFRAPDFTSAASMLGSMAGLHGGSSFHLRNAIIVGIAAVVAVAGPASQTVALEQLRPSPWLAVPAGLALVFMLLLLGGGIPSEFIYFQF